ncbi:hypothetical protein C8R46DRAFT_1184220 [Mycena filopes]|nr:hypothetical protein C8R46DRAFT_1184220 [Mycena filopes]
MMTIYSAGRHLGAVPQSPSKQRRKGNWNRGERKTINQPRVVKRTGLGPPLYEAASVATSVIYWPVGAESEADRHEAPSTPEPLAGLDEFSKHLPNGGTILSIHRPTTSLAWIEDNYDLPEVKSIRKKFGGPLAMMLSAEKPALAIFGPHSSRKMAKLAQGLANRSKFPVISRPAADNPLLQFLTPHPTKDYSLGKTQKMLDHFVTEPVVVMTARVPHDFGENMNTGGVEQVGDFRINGPPSDTGGMPSTSSIAEVTDDGHAANAVIERIPQAIASLGSSDPTTYNHDRKGNGGGDGQDPDGNDPNSEADKWEDWVSPIHLTKSDVTIQGTTQTVHLDIQSHTQFKTYAVGDAPGDLATQGLRPQAQAHAVFTVDFDPMTIRIDRSHAVLGLLAHRPASIVSNVSVDCGLGDPTQTFKHAIGNTVHNDFTATLGISGAVPKLKGAYNHGRAVTRGLEATDSKPMPPCQIEVVQGDRFCARGGKDYRSYNYAYTPRADLLGLGADKRSLLNVGFAVGINFCPYEEERLVQPPQVSYINRNQVFIWVKDDRLRSGTEGTVLFLTNEIPDIRRRSQIIKYHEAEMDFQTARTITSKIHHGKAKDGGLSLALLPLPETEHRPGPSSSFKKFPVGLGSKKIFRRAKPTPRPQVTLTPNEVVSQGWDATNNKWRDAIYPKFDKYLHLIDTATPIADPTVVAYTISPF